MTQLYASVAIGTAATMLLALLVLMRPGTPGHRPFFALGRRWIAVKSQTSGLVLILLSAVAITAFAQVGPHGLSDTSAEAQLANVDPEAMQDTERRADEGSLDARALEALRSFSGQISAVQRPPTAQSTGENSAAIPDVETMIAQLFDRLKQNPADVNGWKMLGWSYLNTSRPEEAKKAYETALKLAPDDNEIAQGLETAMSAQKAPAAASSPGQSGSTPTPPAAETTAGVAPSGEGNESMYHAMVEKLETRLKATPDDEDGWMRLMRSRVVLGEKDAAKSALGKALATFASDDAAKSRLEAAARELGIAHN